MNLGKTERSLLIWQQIDRFSSRATMETIYLFVMQEIEKVSITNIRVQQWKRNAAGMVP
jgi:hypothetical protein